MAVPRSPVLFGVGTKMPRIRAHWFSLVEHEIMLSNVGGRIGGKQHQSPSCHNMCHISDSLSDITFKEVHGEA